MDSGHTETRPSIFQALLSPQEKDKDYVVPTVDDLKDEAYSILAASADTTGNAMTVAAYQVVSNPEIYKKVRRELEAGFPDPNERLDFVRLETLPYLVGLLSFDLETIDS
jgi:cytochrome P450